VGAYKYVPTPTSGENVATSHWRPVVQLMAADAEKVSALAVGARQARIECFKTIDLSEGSSRAVEIKPVRSLVGYSTKEELLTQQIQELCLFSSIRSPVM